MDVCIPYVNVVLMLKIAEFIKKKNWLYFEDVACLLTFCTVY